MCKRLGGVGRAEEKDVGVTGNPIALTITWSFALFPDAQARSLRLLTAT